MRLIVDLMLGNIAGLIAPSISHLTSITRTRHLYSDNSDASVRSGASLGRSRLVALTIGADILLFGDSPARSHSPVHSFISLPGKGFVD